MSPNGLSPSPLREIYCRVTLLPSVSLSQLRQS
jgi:hypothetical protein